MNIVNRAQSQIFEHDGVNDAFILYLEGVIRRDHFVDNMLKICYASADATRPSKDRPIRIVEKIQTIHHFLLNNQKLEELLYYALAMDGIDKSERKAALNVALIFGYDVNALGPKGETALISAASCGETDIAKVLLQRKGIDVNIQDDYGRTALIFSVIHRKIDIAKALLQRKEIDVNIQDSYRRTALICTALCGQTDTAKVMLQRKEIDVNVRDSYHRTALRIAIEENRIKIIQLLVQKLSKNSDIEIRRLLQTELQAQTIQINQKIVKLPAINTTTPEELIKQFTTDIKVTDTATELVEAEMLSASKESSNCSISL